MPPHSIASRALGFCNENAAVAGFIVADPQEDNPKIGGRVARTLNSDTYLGAPSRRGLRVGLLTFIYATAGGWVRLLILPFDSFCGCPILAGCARVGIFPLILSSPRTPLLSCPVPSPLTIKTNPRTSARQAREPCRNKIAHRRFCTFRTSSWHGCTSRLAALALRIPVLLNPCTDAQ